MRRLNLLILAIVCLCAGQAQAYCFARAGQRYHIDPLLLEAIAIHESGLRAGVVNNNGSRLGLDYGVMQINSHHVPELVRLGVIRSAQDLLTDPCLNVQVGAWILARHLQVCGVNWNCLGSYNAGFAARTRGRRDHYASDIYVLYDRLNTRRLRQAGHPVI